MDALLIKTYFYVSIHRIYIPLIQLCGACSPVGLTAQPSFALRRRNLKTEISLQKTHQIFFRPHYAEERKPDLCLSKSVREILWMSWCHRFRKDPFSKCFPSMHNKAKRCRFRDRLVCTVDLTRVFVRFFGLDLAQNTIAVYYWLGK